jgi:hypothetical protein
MTLSTLVLSGLTSHALVLQGSTHCPVLMCDHWSAMTLVSLNSNLYQYV